MSPSPLANVVERRPGVWFARVWVPGVGTEPRRQVGRMFRGGKKAVRAEVEAELKGRAPQASSVTVAEMLEMWQAAKQHEWQPTTARELGRTTSRRAARERS